MLHRRRLARFAASLPLALLVPLASLAQEAPPAAAPAPAAEEAASPAIEEITVTAQKRAESVQDVPISVAAIGGEQLEDLKLTDTNDIAGLVPNLQVNQVNGDGSPVFSLRGVTMNDYSVHQSSPVAVYTDEVYAGPTVLQPIQMFDLERVEVLRGPQGTLYGRNTTGGAVNLITKAPDFETNGYLTAGYGNFSRYEVRAAAGVPIVDDVLAVRLAGYWLDADGWFDNQFPGLAANNSSKEWAVRGSLLWQPTDTIDATVRYSAGRSDPTDYGIFAANIAEIGDPPNGVGVGGGIYSLYNTAPPPAAFNPPDHFRSGLDKWELESNGDIKRRREVDQASLHVNIQLSESFTLSSITSWTQGDYANPEDSDGSPMEVIEAHYFGDGDQITQELRITSDLEGAFDFVAGFYYSVEQLDVATDLALFTDIDFNLSGAVDPYDCLDPWIAAGAQPGPGSPTSAAAEAWLNGFGLGLVDLVALGCTYRNSFEQERTSIAGFFDGTLEIFTDTTLLFGLRVTNDKTEADDYRTFAEGSGVDLFDTIPLSDAKIDDTELTWKFGLEQRVGEDALFYFTYSRGYRSGAFNGQAFFDPSEFNAVEPETLDAIEAGVKSTLADGRLQLNGAVFYYIYKQQQLIDVDPNTGAQLLVNIEESNVAGFEVEALAQVTDALRLSAGLGYLDGEAAEGIVSGVDISGEILPNSPDWNVHFAGDWDFLRTDFGTASAHLDTGYVAEQYYTLPHASRTLIDAYWLVNMRLGFAGQDDRWEVAFWMKNLADEWYQTNIISLSGFGLDYSHIGPPRTYGGEVTFRF